MCALGPTRDVKRPKLEALHAKLKTELEGT